MPPPSKNIEGSTKAGPADAGAGTAGRSSLGEINSRALLSGTSCIAIRHGESVYWLRATRQGKLLLTK